jgi:hypothetical protein
MPGDAAARVATSVVAPESVSPGHDAALTLILTNTSDGQIPLTFEIDVAVGAVDPPVITAVDGKGASTSDPTGVFGCPGGLPARLAAEADQLDLTVLATTAKTPTTMAVVLQPHGRARLAVAWRANGVVWGPPVKTARGCTDKLVPSPLAPGDFTLTMKPPAVASKKQLAPTTAHISVQP